MTWNIASAKQQFSEVVRLTAEEPQAIYNRNTPVAVMVNPETFQAFERWQAARRLPSLLDEFALVRAELAASGWDGIDLPARTDRPNAVVDMLDQEAALSPRAT